MTSYSYKPATGLEGASTVVPLKDGGFLEVRRGSKTRWTDGEERNVWPSLEAWKATLPADATVVERVGRPSSLPAVPVYPADFTTALKVYSKEKRPYNSRLVLETNVTEAKRHRRRAAYLRQRMRISCFYPSGYQLMIDNELKDAEEVMAAPAYEKWHNKGQIRQYKILTETIHAQRISDGAFVPIFFDLTRGVLHTPVSDHAWSEVIKGTTFAELGVRPIFMRRTGTVMRMVVPEEEMAAQTMAVLFPATGSGTVST